MAEKRYMLNEPIVMVMLHVNGLATPVRVDRIEAIVAVPAVNRANEPTGRASHANLILFSGAVQAVDETPTEVMRMVLNAVTGEVEQP